MREGKQNYYSVERCRGMYMACRIDLRVMNGAYEPRRSKDLGALHCFGVMSWSSSSR